MKKIILFFLCTSFFTIACDNEGDESSVMIRQSPEVLLSMYIGSPSGGKEVLKTDSAQLIFKYFNYNSSLYSGMSVEFHGGMITYINNNIKMVSQYEFVGDSLFAYKSDGSKIFIACGSTEELYLAQSFCRYPGLNHDGTEDSTYITTNTSLVDVDKALELSKYNALTDMSSGSDSLVWLNVRYIFK